MKIGLIVYGPLDRISGGYLYDRKLVDYLRKQGDDVDVLALPWRNYFALLRDNLQYRLPGGYDLLIQDELNHPSLLVANSFKHACPVISLVHHLRSSEPGPAWLQNFYGLFERSYLRSVDGFIFNSSTTRREVEANLKTGLPAVIAYPPTDRFGEPIAELMVIARAAESGPLRLVFLGNIIARKGLHILLDALGLLSTRCWVSSPHSPGGTPIGFHLDIAGSLHIEPRYSISMTSKVTELGLGACVQFHGVLEEGPLSTLLNLAHVLVVPSLYEGFGIAYLEGMCFGLPAIGTPAGGATEIITDGVDGFLVPPGNHVVLADRLESLARDRGLLCRMGLAARQRYLGQPTWTDTAAKIRKYLVHLVA